MEHEHAAHGGPNDQMAMALLMLWMMPTMFPDHRTNHFLDVVFAALFLLSLYGMQAQALVGDNQFLRAMIPHHSGAILMCEKSHDHRSENQAAVKRNRSGPEGGNCADEGAVGTLRRS